MLCDMARPQRRSAFARNSRDLTKDYNGNAAERQLRRADTPPQGPYGIRGGAQRLGGAGAAQGASAQARRESVVGNKVGGASQS